MNVSTAIIEFFKRRLYHFSTFLRVGLSNSTNGGREVTFYVACAGERTEPRNDLPTNQRTFD